MTSKTSLRHDAASGAIKAGTTATLTRTFTADFMAALPAGQHTMTYVLHNAAGNPSNSRVEYITVER